MISRDGLRVGGAKYLSQFYVLYNGSEKGYISAPRRVHRNR